MTVEFADFIVAIETPEVHPALESIPPLTRSAALRVGSLARRPIRYAMPAMKPHFLRSPSPRPTLASLGRKPVVSPVFYRISLAVWGHGRRVPAFSGTVRDGEWSFHEGRQADETIVIRGDASLKTATRSSRWPWPVHALLLLTGACAGDSPAGPSDEPDAPAVEVVVEPGSHTLTSLGATVRLMATAKDASGAPVAGRTFTWSTSAAAVATVAADGTVSAEGNGTALVSARTGAVTGSATIVVTSNQARVGPPGATIELGSGAVRLTFPLGAVSGNIIVTVTPATTSSANANFLPGTAFDFQPEGTTFAVPVTLSIGYDPATLPSGTSESQLRIYKVTGTTWVEAAGNAVNPATRRVAASLDGFSTYGIGAALVITAPPTLPDATVGEPYATTLTASGGGGSSTWSLESGALPQDLGLASSGVITGTPSISGTFEFEVRVVNGQGQSASVVLTLVVSPRAGSVNVEPSAATIRVGATLQLTASMIGGDAEVVEGTQFTWTSSDTLLASVTSDGLVTGVAPGGPVMVTASAGALSGTATVTIIDSALPPNRLAAGTQHTCVLTQAAKRIVGERIRMASWETARPTAGSPRCR